MNELPIFTIITVTYNAEKEIDRTISSVLMQSYKKIEYLIIDGASKDNTLNIIKEKTPSFGFITVKIISEPDNGIYDAMNKGLSMASGTYVWFLNAGDSFQSIDTIQNVAEIAKKNNLPDIIYGETNLVDNNGNYIANRRLKAPKHLSWKSFRMGMLVCHQAFIVKKNIAYEYDLQYHYSSDYDWCIKCMKQAKSIINSNYRLVNYQYEGTTTENRITSLKERYNIMCFYYGTFQTQIRHIWFTIRFLTAKFFKKNS